MHSAGLCCPPAALGTTTNAEVCEFSAATDSPPGGCRRSARASLRPAIFSYACICITLVPLITLTVCLREHRWLLGAGERPSSRAGSSLQARRHVEVNAWSCRWVCWGGSETARIPVGGVRASRDARAFVLAISTTSPELARVPDRPSGVSPTPRPTFPRPHPPGRPLGCLT